jgi:hypothetical protein
MLAVSANKSRPIYPQSLIFDPAGRAHLVALSGNEAAELVSRTLPPPCGPISVLTVNSDAPAFRGVSGFNIEPCDDEASLLERARTILEESTMGIRVYAVGPEAFLWLVDGVAQGFGFGKYEVVKLPVGSIARRLYCSHCKTVDYPVTDNLHCCSGCGLTLQVRDHFSRRLGAFMGVRADAEAPGELPTREEMFR